MKKQDFENTEYGCWCLKKTEFNWRLPYLPLFWIIFLIIHTSQVAQCKAGSGFAPGEPGSSYSPPRASATSFGHDTKKMYAFLPPREKYTRIPNYNSI